MEIYSFLRQLADSWALLGLVVVFIGVVLFVFRPGARKSQKDAAESIFRNEDRPQKPGQPDGDDDEEERQ